MVDFTKIELGLDFLLKNDGYLLKNNISERTITHKLAEYLQGLFWEWNVDCEFDHNIDSPKEIDLKPKELLYVMAEYFKKMYPDYREKIMDFVTEEEAKNLERQLRDPRINYIADLDIYIFVLKLISGKKIKKKIYPDIIIHHRGTHENHIVIETKKTSNKEKEGYIYDLLKLGALTSSPKYKYKKGIFIKLPVLRDFNALRAFKRNKSLFPKVFEYLPYCII